MYLTTFPTTLRKTVSYFHSIILNLTENIAELGIEYLRINIEDNSSVPI